MIVLNSCDSNSRFLMFMIFIENRLKVRYNFLNDEKCFYFNQYRTNLKVHEANNLPD